MDSRLKELRKIRGYTQRRIGNDVGTSQQNISKYEQNIYSMPIDMLIRMSEYFNVTTDYLLGISEVKHNYKIFMKADKIIDESYELVELYRNLNQRDKDIIWAMMEQMRKMDDKTQ